MHSTMRVTKGFKPTKHAHLRGILTLGMGAPAPSSLAHLAMPMKAE